MIAAVFWPKHVSALRESLVVFCILLFSLCLTFWPVLKYPFGWHDDYMSWQWNGSDCATHVSYNACFMFGRPIGAWVICGVGYFLVTLGMKAFPYAKLITLIWMALVGTLTFCWFLKNEISRFCALMLSFIIFTFPFGQVTAAMAYNTIEILSMLPAVVAALIIFPFLGRPVETFPRRKLLWRGTSFVFLIILSLSIYQSGAMYVWSLLGVALISMSVQDWKKLRRSYLFLFVLNGAAYLLYYGGIRLLFVVAEAEKKGWYTAKIAAGLNKPFTFVHVILPIGFSPWNFWLENYWNQVTSLFSQYLYLCLFLLAFGALVLQASKQARREGLLRREIFSLSLEKIIGFLCLIPLTVLPNLLGNLSHFGSRMCMAISSFFVFGVFRIMEGGGLIFLDKKTVRRGLFVFLCVGCVYGAFTANYYVLHDYVIPQRYELDYMKRMLQNNPLNQFSRIHVIVPGDNRIRRPFSYLDEYGLRLAHYADDLKGILISILDELGDDHSLSRLSIELPVQLKKGILGPLSPLHFSFSSRADYQPLQEATLVIEFDKLPPIHAGTSAL